MGLDSWMSEEDAKMMKYYKESLKSGGHHWSYKIIQIQYFIKRFIFFIYDNLFFYIIILLKILK